MNFTLFKALIDGYNKIAFTHNYILGFAYKGTVYASYQTAEAIPFVTTLDKAKEKKDGMALRFKPTVKQKILLLTNAEPICSVDYFEACCKEKHLNIKGEKVKYNRGEIFEKVITERFGQVWVKDHTPFTEDADVVGNGIPYQVKYEKATFTNERSLANLTLKWLQKNLSK